MQASAPCRLLTHTNGNLTVVRIDGEHIELDEIKALWFRDRLKALVEGRRQLAVDLANVLFITSTTVETLLGLNRELTALGGHLLVCNPSPLVLEVFSVLHLDDILDIRTTAEEDPGRLPAGGNGLRAVP